MDDIMPYEHVKNLKKNLPSHKNRVSNNKNLIRKLNFMPFARLLYDSDDFTSAHEKNKKKKILIDKRECPWELKSSRGMKRGHLWN